MRHLNTVEDLVIDPSFRRWILHHDPEARAQWQAYLSAHPEKKALVEKAKLLLEELPRVNYQMSKQELSVLWHQIERKSEQTVSPIPIVAGKVRKFPWYYLAASITALLLIAGAGFWYFHTQNAITTYRTQYGETRQITLPDGSRVTLNANSTLYFNAQQFSQQSRSVWMKGEAFFEVNRLATDEGKAAKFAVHTDDLEVEVLGTEFNVNTRRLSTKVVLTTGKIRLNLARMEGNLPIIMHPGEMVTYTSEQKTVKKENVNLNVHTAWKQHELIFEDTPVREIIALLEDNYGLKINLQNKEAANRHYTGTFKNPNPDIILMALTALFKLEMERHDHIIILK